MSKARLLADLMSDSQITASEITGLELNAIQEGDTVVEVVDDGAGGKVVVRVDGSNNAEFNSGGMVVPSGTTAERDPNAAIGSLRYNTTTGFFETLTTSGWGAVATPPSITSISPTSFNGEAGATFTINGAFFDAASIAVLKGSDGTEYAVGTVTFVSNSQLTVTNATNLPVSNEPFRVKVTNGAGLSIESVTTIDAGSVPSFTTAAGNIATTTQWDDPVSVTVQATDAENTITGYALTQGNLPSGLTLDTATGTISGTSSNQATTTYTFTIEATDSAGNTNTRQFNIQIVNAAPVWSSPTSGQTFEETLGIASSGITLSAADPEGQAVTYTSSSLPAGMNITGSTITGTPTVEQNYSVTVSASDGFSSANRSFFINVLPDPVDTWAEYNASSAGGQMPTHNFAPSLQGGWGYSTSVADGLRFVGDVDWYLYGIASGGLTAGSMTLDVYIYDTTNNSQVYYEGGFVVGSSSIDTMQLTGPVPRLIGGRTYQVETVPVSVNGANGYYVANRTTSAITSEGVQITPQSGANSAILTPNRSGNGTSVGGGQIFWLAAAAVGHL